MAMTLTLDPVFIPTTALGGDEANKFMIGQKDMKRGKTM